MCVILISYEMNIDFNIIANHESGFIIANRDNHQFFIRLILNQPLLNEIYCLQLSSFE